MFLRTITFKPFSPLHVPSEREWDTYVRSAIDRAHQFHDPADGPFVAYRDTSRQDVARVLVSAGAFAALARSGFGDFTLGADVDESSLEPDTLEKLR